MIDFLKSPFATAMLLLLLLSACGSAPPRLPQALEQARKTEQAAQRAWREGALLRARELFQKLVLMQQSLENFNAASEAAISLATVHHKLGEDKQALEVLDGQLSDHAAFITPELKAVALFRKGIILADMGKLEDAHAVTEQARQLCKGDCAPMPGIYNLLARLALEKNDIATALAMAKQATGSASREELANSHRLSARAEALSGRHDAAIEQYQSALTLDRELALSARIALDLNGIAAALEQLGRKQEAAEYTQRANLVSRARETLSPKPAGK